MNLMDIIQRMLDEQKWREQEAQKLRGFRPAPKDAAGNITDYNWDMRYHDGNMEQGLAQLFKQKNERMNLNTRPLDWAPENRFNFLNHLRDKEDLLKSRGGI